MVEKRHIALTMLLSLIPLLFFSIFGLALWSMVTTPRLPFYGFKEMKNEVTRLSHLVGPVELNEVRSKTDPKYYSLSGAMYLRGTPDELRLRVENALATEGWKLQQVNADPDYDWSIGLCKGKMNLTIESIEEVRGHSKVFVYANRHSSRFSRSGC